MRDRNISMYTLINGYYSRQVRISDEDMYKASACFREFLVSTCKSRGNRARQFASMTFTNKKQNTLYTRLVCNLETSYVEYIAGQDYSSEMEALKKALLGN